MSAATEHQAISPAIIGDENLRWMRISRLRPALLGLCICLGFVVVPTGAMAFNCPTPGPNCTCFPTPICVEQLHINNPEVVHLKVYVLGNINGAIWQIRQNGQIEGNNGEQTYVYRSADESHTNFSLQRCAKTFTGATSCNGWEQASLAEPSVKQLKACDKYADKAVAAAKENISNSCGFPSDGRFSKDRKGHWNWCANLADADRHFMNDETNARQQGLNDCKAKIAANAAEVAKNFTGSWAVSMQPVGDFTFVLTQQGPAVNGQMVNADPTKNGTIQGSLENDNQHVSFSYVQPQSNAGGQGRFWMELTKDKLGGRFFINGEQAVRLLDGTRK